MKRHKNADWQIRQAFGPWRVRSRSSAFRPTPCDLRHATCSVWNSTITMYLLLDGSQISMDAQMTRGNRDSDSNTIRYSFKNLARIVGRLSTAFTSVYRESGYGLDLMCYLSVHALQEQYHQQDQQQQQRQQQQQQPQPQQQHPLSVGRRRE